MDTKRQAQSSPSDAGGDWTGTWWPHIGASAEETARRECKQLDCQVVRRDDVWQATFAGECGRPYKFTITMEGRQAGDVVLFRGTTDLGAQDGGVFDWIGRAAATEFVGFFTSAHYAGEFRLTRKE